MKRFFFMTLALAAMAASCTKGGLLESPATFQDPINFEPYTGKAPVTKATVAGEETLMEGFRVIGFKEDASGNILSDQLSTPFLRKMVTGTGEDETTWSYLGDMFWPKENLSFVAYGLNVNTTPDVPTPTAITEQGPSYGDATIGSDDVFKMGADYSEFIYEVPTARAEQKDLIISPMSKGNNSGTVTMRLYHVLSRVGFSVDIVNDTEILPEVEITSIELAGNFISEATFDLEKAVVSGESVTYNVSGTPSDLVYEFIDEDEPSFKASAKGKTPIDITDNEDRFFMIVPTGPDTGVGEGAYVKVTYSIGGVEQTPATLPLAADFKFLAGKAYEFVFTLSTVEVGFTVDVEDWDPQNPETYPVK